MTAKNGGLPPDVRHRIEALERQLAEMQGVAAVLLAINAASCIGRYRPDDLVELRERVVSSLLATPLGPEAIDGAESAVATFLRAIRLADALRGRGDDSKAVA